MEDEEKRQKLEMCEYRRKFKTSGKRGNDGRGEIEGRTDNDHTTGEPENHETGIGFGQCNGLKRTKSEQKICEWVLFPRSTLGEPSHISGDSNFFLTDQALVA